MKRPVVLLVAILTLTILTGCGGQKNLTGTWINPEGQTTTIDKEWFVASNGTQSRYEITGDTSLKLTRDGESTELRYTLKGNTLTLNQDGKEMVFTRANTKEGDAAVATATKQQNDEKARQTCEVTRGAVETSSQWVTGLSPSVAGDYKALVALELKQRLVTGKPDEFLCPSGGTMTSSSADTGGVKVTCSVHGTRN